MAGAWFMPPLALVLFAAGMTVTFRAALAERLVTVLISVPLTILGGAIPMALWCTAHHWQ